MGKIYWYAFVVWFIEDFSADILAFLISFRRGALIIRRLCVLLNAERVYRELSTILEGESDLDFASVMVQVLLISYLSREYHSSVYTE